MLILKPDININVNCYVGFDPYQDGYLLVQDWCDCGEALVRTQANTEVDTIHNICKPWWKSEECAAMMAMIATDPAPQWPNIPFIQHVVKMLPDVDAESSLLKGGRMGGPKCTVQV